MDREVRFVVVDFVARKDIVVGKYFLNNIHVSGEIREHGKQVSECENRDYFYLGNDTQDSKEMVIEKNLRV